MNPVIVPSFAPHSRTAAAASHGKTSMDGGFRDALDKSGGRHGHRSGVDSDPNAAARKLAERLAEREDSAERPAQREIHVEPETQGDAPVDDKAARSDLSSDGEKNADNDGETAIWIDTRTPAPAFGNKARVSDHAGQDADHESGRNRDGLATDAKADARKAEPGEVRQTNPHAGEVICAEAQTSWHAGETPRAAASTAEPRQATAGIATANDKASQPVSSHRPEAAAALAAADADPDGDAPQVRLVSDPQPKGPVAYGMQQMPFGSAVAMLNLTTRGASAASAQTVAEPVSNGRMGKAVAHSDILSIDDAPLSPEAESDEAPRISMGVSSSENAGTASTASDSNADARGSSPNGDPDIGQSTITARPGEPPVMTARLGTTAAGVVETLASAPAVNAARTASQADADTKTVAAATHSLKIQLRPVELGEITATLRMNGDVLTVEMSPEKMEAYDRLNTDSDAIVKALRGLGLQVDQITIQPPQVASAAPRSDGSLQNQASGGGNQQSAQTGNSGGGSEGQRGAASHGEQRNGGQTDRATSPDTENRPGRGLVI